MDIFTLGAVAVLGILLITTLPLYFAVRFLGGEASIFKVIAANIVVGVIYFFVPSLFAFVLLLFVYKMMFDLSWFGAFCAWIIQFIIGALLVFGAIFFLPGISFPGLY